MRMIALGQLLRDHGHDVHLATITASTAMLAAGAEFTIHQLRSDIRIGSTEDARGLAALARGLASQWIVLDGPAFQTEYQRVARSAGSKLMSVDDTAACHFVSDVVVNQNYGAEMAEYSTEPYTARYLGIRYLMLRREFRTATPRAHRPEPPHLALVSLGGGATLAVDALTRLIPVLERVAPADLRFRLITGMLAGISDGIAELARSRADRFDVTRRVETMSLEMDAADIAITGGGSTIWELMRMRVPFLAVSLNAPQATLLKALQDKGACVHLGSAAELQLSHARRIEEAIGDVSLRRTMIRAGSALVDLEDSNGAILSIFTRS